VTIYYGSNVANGTLSTACTASSTTGGVEASVTTTVSGGNHVCEIQSQAASIASVTAIPSPTGKGWVTTPPGAGSFATGNWSASCTFQFGSFNSGNTVTLRFFQYTGSYISIGQIVATITTTAKTTYSFAATSLSGVTFGSTDLLYIDAWLTDSSGTGGDNPIVFVSNSATQGVANDMQITTSTFTGGGHLLICDGYGGVFS